MWLRKIFRKKRKITHPIIKDKKVTYSNSSRKLLTETKHAINLIPVKSYKQGLVFFVTKTVKDTENHLLKLAKVFHINQCLSLFQCFPAF